MFCLFLETDVPWTLKDLEILQFFSGIGKMDSQNEKSTYIYIYKISVLPYDTSVICATKISGILIHF